MPLSVLILSIILLILSVILVFVILLQSGKTAGLSGSIAGGAETFFGKNRGRTIDTILYRWTGFIAAVFAIITIVINILSSNA